MEMMNKRISAKSKLVTVAIAGLAALGIILLHFGRKVRAKSDSPAAVSVGVTLVTRKSLQRQIKLSSELVPFQEIDVHAKESGLSKTCTSTMAATCIRVN